MEQVDFCYVGKEGLTIYSECFQRYFSVSRYIWPGKKNDLSELVANIEEIFFYLVNQANKYGFNVDSILETPSSTGSTCFGYASGCSEKISKASFQIYAFS